MIHTILNSSYLYSGQKLFRGLFLSKYLIACLGICSESGKKQKREKVSERESELGEDLVTLKTENK